MVFYREISNYFEELNATIEHELTHYIQYKFLHPSNKDKKIKYDSRRPDFDKDDYYSSRVEFDPTIKSELAKFLFLMKTYDFPKGDPQGWPPISDCVKTFVGACKKTDDCYFLGMSESEFFEALKRKKPSAYKKAVKLFTIELYKLVPETKRKFWTLED